MPRIIRSQRTGHGQYVETRRGRSTTASSWGGRSRVPERHRALLVRWAGDGARTLRLGARTAGLYLEAGGLLPREEVPGLADVQPRAAPGDRACVRRRQPACGVPVAEGHRQKPARIFRMGDGALTLIGRESIGSWFEQALVAPAGRSISSRRRGDGSSDLDPEDLSAGGRADDLLQPAQVPRAGRHRRARGGTGRSGSLSCPGDWPDAALTPSFPDMVLLEPGPVRAAGRGRSLRGPAVPLGAKGDGDWQRIGPDSRRPR